jgi:hypothetical protein
MPCPPAILAAVFLGIPADADLIGALMLADSQHLRSVPLPDIMTD